jgi:hypothetical protein
LYSAFCSRMSAKSAAMCFPAAEVRDLAPTRCRGVD